VVSGSAVAAAVLALVGRKRRTASLLFLTAVAAETLGRIWSRRNPRPIPAALRWVLRTPHPLDALRRALAARPGERVLEIGPGLGQHAVEVARWLLPDGSLDVLDLQQEMLDATMRRAAGRGVHNIEPALGDASARLPYPDARFDAAYLMTVLSELPDRERTLAELRRVLKPGGRLVVGEVVADPGFAPLGKLVALAERQGFRFAQRFGPPVAYFARFVVASPQPGPEPPRRHPGRRRHRGAGRRARGGAGGHGELMAAGGTMDISRSLRLETKRELLTRRWPISPAGPG
jgi:SAM-dependent methyltransferase